MTLDILLEFDILAANTEPPLSGQGCKIFIYQNSGDTKFGRSNTQELDAIIQQNNEAYNGTEIETII